MSDVRIRPNTENYVKGWSGNGKRTKINGDMVSHALSGMTNDEIKGILGKLDNEIDVDKFDHLNVGQVRMCLGGCIRGRLGKIKREAMKSEGATESDGDDAAEAALDKAIGKQLRKTVDKRIEEWEKAAADRAAKAEEKAKAAA